LPSANQPLFATNCPRISPFGFFAVCTFTYVPCFWIVLRSDAGIVEVPDLLPVAAEPHGVQSGTMTLPATPV
jgi:hypothetical protein